MIKRIAVSGCAGAGKTSLVNEMARRGWQVCENIASQVARAEMPSDGGAPPPHDAERFARLCLAACIDELLLLGGGPVIYDGSLVDVVLAVRRFGKMRGGDEHVLQVMRYADPVFIAPPWRELFNAESTGQSWDQAMREYTELCAAFADAGYDTLTLPQLPLKERADWLEAAIRNTIEVVV